MRDPRELYEISPGPWAEIRGQGVPVIHLLEGFLDAGRVLQGTARHLLRSSDPVRVATFDIDQLHDYRSRRPVMTFDTFQWVGVVEPKLVLDQLTDATGRPYLLLHGPEPDSQWERTIQAVLGICDELGAGRLYTVTGIPMAVPHSRPIGLTRTATDEGLVHDNPPLIERMDVPGHWSGLLQYRAGQAGRVGMGYVAHVPHYLSQVYFPQALSVVLDGLMDDTGLVIPSLTLKDEMTETLDLINGEIEQSADTKELVQALEEAYDTATESVVPVPTADEIGAEFERFLAERENGEKDDGRF